MKEITRNIILDLLPAYIAGEASAETRALVEEFAKGDAEIARLISGEGSLPDHGLTQPPANLEMQAIKKLRKKIRSQSWYMGLAIFCSAIAVSYQWNNETGFRWTFADAPGVAALLALIALFFWVRFYMGKRWMLKR